MGETGGNVVRDVPSLGEFCTWDVFFVVVVAFYCQLHYLKSGFFSA